MPLANQVTILLMMVNVKNVLKANTLQRLEQALVISVVVVTNLSVTVLDALFVQLDSTPVMEATANHAHWDLILLLMDLVVAQLVDLELKLT